MPQTTAQLLEALAHTTVSWPWKSIRLRRGSVADSQQRPFSAQVSVAELYHENTKLFPQMLSDLAAASVPPDDFRKELVRRRSEAEAATPVPRAAIAESWQTFLTETARNVELELFFAVEIRLLLGDRLIAYEPVCNSFLPLKQLSSGEARNVRRAVHLLGRPAGDSLLFITGVFSRNAVLLGPRGYRRTLIEAGRVAQEIVRQVRKLDLHADVVQEFTDRDVDAALESDGVEEGTLLVILIGDTPNAS